MYFSRAHAINTQEGKEENSALIHIKVIPKDQPSEFVKPEFIIKPEDVQVAKGTQQATLECVANAKPLYLLETLWFKDGVLIDNSDALGFQTTFNDFWNRSLTLISLNEAHTGKYECRVELKTGNFPSISASAQVTVLEKPVFVSSVKLETLGDYGSPLTLPCNAVGIPPPNVTWYRNAEALDEISDDRYKVQEDNSLAIKRLTIADMGMFQCFARNEAGESAAAVWVKVKSKYLLTEAVQFF